MQASDPPYIVLIDRNCHKSHHYGLVLLPARTRCTLDRIPAAAVRDLWRRGAPSFQALLDPRPPDSCTGCVCCSPTASFDGVYNPRRVMEEVLAIKPDICFCGTRRGMRLRFAK